MVVIEFAFSHLSLSQCLFAQFSFLLQSDLSLPGRKHGVGQPQLANWTQQKESCILRGGLSDGFCWSDMPTSWPQKLASEWDIILGKCTIMAATPESPGMKRGILPKGNRGAGQVWITNSSQLCSHQSEITSVNILWYILFRTFGDAYTHTHYFLQTPRSQRAYFKILKQKVTQGRANLWREKGNNPLFSFVVKKMTKNLSPLILEPDRK